MKKFTFYCFLALLSVGLALGVSDLFVLTYQLRREHLDRFIRTDLATKATRLGQPFDHRPAFQVVAEERLSHPDTYPILPASLSFTPGQGLNKGKRPIVNLGGISQVRTVYCNENGKYLIYQADEHGFHNPHGLYTPPLQVMVVGDSFAHGACVESSQTLAAHLRQSFPRTLTLGYADNGPLEELGAVLEYGVALKPEHVLWLYYEGNDIDGIETGLKAPQIRAYLEGKTQGLMQLQPELDHRLAALAEEQMKEAEQRFRLLLGPEAKDRFLAGLRGTYKARNLRRYLGLVPPLSVPFAGEDAETDQLRLFHDTLRLARDRIRSWKGKLVFVYLPQWVHFEASAPIKRKDRGRILDMARALGLEVIDTVPRFERFPLPTTLFPFQGPGHYTAEGYRIVADAILSQLTKK